MEGRGHAGGEAGGYAMNIATGADEGIRFVHRDQAFERSLEDLRKKGGMASEAAAKAEEFIAAVLTGRGDGGREKFRFTRKGEYRIRNCRKIDLSRGYRLVCYLKDGHLVLLYAGTHDECFRWIERHRTAEYDLESVAANAWMNVDTERFDERTLREPISEAERFSEAYEVSLMDQLDDAVLRRVFSGLTDRR